MRRRIGARRGEQLGYLFIMTYGRSGSTLVQGILNSIPGYLVRGENRDALHHLFAYHQTLVKEAARVTREDGSRLPVTHPFYGMDDFSAEVSLDRIRQLATATVLRPPRPLPIGPEAIARPELVSCPSAGGRTTHALLYRPVGTDVVGPADELPPLVVMILLPLNENAATSPKVPAARPR